MNRVPTTPVCILLALTVLALGCGVQKTGGEATSPVAPVVAPQPATITHPASKTPAVVVPTNPAPVVGAAIDVQSEVSEDSAKQEVHNETVVSVVVPPEEHLLKDSDKVPEKPQQQEVTPSTFAIVSPIGYGPLRLEERILRADVIARVRLSSTAPATHHRPWHDPNQMYYKSLAVFTFDVLEVLQGTLGQTTVVELQIPSVVNKLAPVTMTEAQTNSTEWVNNIGTHWDWSSRDAIVFLWDADRSNYKESYSGRLPSVQYVFSGDDYDGVYWDNNDTVSVNSDYNRVWLPATTTDQDASTFYLEDPDKTDAETITLAALKTKISQQDTLVDDTVTGHKRCLLSKMKSQRSNVDELPTHFFEVHNEVPSGQPAGTYVRGRPEERHATHYPSFTLSGPDSDLFQWVRIDSDTDPSNGYRHEFQTKRPLPKGQYESSHQFQNSVHKPCNYTSRETVTVTVTAEAPTDVLHGLFFDPANVGTTIKADATNGVLKPVSFTDPNGASATIISISYESDTVKTEVTPGDALDGHILDIIELDGTVSLSLDVFDATVDSANDTLSWTVSSAPWEDGDLLMVRIREAR